MSNRIRFCSYCGAGVTPGGNFCKTCGTSLVGQDQPLVTRSDGPVSIELTDKKWKGLMVQGRIVITVGVVIWFCAMFMFFDGTSAKNSLEAELSFYVWYFSIAVAVVGMVITGYARHQAWWHHG